MNLLRKLLARLTPEPTWENATAVLGAVVILLAGTFVLALCALVLALVVGP